MAEPDPEEILVEGDAETRELTATHRSEANVGDILSSATFEKRSTSDGAAPNFKSTTA